MGYVTDYINKAMERVDDLKKEIAATGIENDLVCFRGECEDYGETKLMPTLFREKSRVLKDNELIELLCDYDIPNSDHDNSLSKVIMGQHYIEISRLLDVTFNILTALYFACDKIEEDGFIYCFVFPESFSPNSYYLQQHYNKIVEGKFKPYSRDFKVITHSHNNERIKLQSGGFILFSGNTFTKIPKEYYGEPVKIDKVDKSEVRKELHVLFNVNESSLFPEKDKRKDIIKAKLGKSAGNVFAESKHLRSELNYYLRRVESEVIIKKNKKEEDSIAIRRFMRKEKSDIINFIKENFPIEKEYEMIEEIENEFRIIEKGIVECQ